MSWTFIAISSFFFKFVGLFFLNVPVSSRAASSDVGGGQAGGIRSGEEVAEALLGQVAILVVVEGLTRQLAKEVAAVQLVPLQGAARRHQGFCAAAAAETTEGGTRRKWSSPHHDTGWQLCVRFTLVRIYWLPVLKQPPLFHCIMQKVSATSCHVKVRASSGEHWWTGESGGQVWLVFIESLGKLIRLWLFLFRTLLDVLFWITSHMKWDNVDQLDITCNRHSHTKQWVRFQVSDLQY